MDSKNAHNGLKNFLALQKQGIPHTEFRLGRTTFRLSDAPNDDDCNPLVRRDDVWQDMLRMVLGHVPEGAEHAPPCYCELIPDEKRNFAGLAGLPSAVRLMDGFFPVRNQGKRGSCFAFALVALCEYMLGKTVKLSEQSLFYFTKLATPGKIEDSYDGAVLLDSIHAVEDYGICPLSEWHYNPESWNYVEDPHNKSPGTALLRKLELAQKYRFRNWRTLSQGSVLQFKQALSAGFPIYTGLGITREWLQGEARRTGVIPFPKLRWRLCVLPPPLGLIRDYLAQNGIDPDSKDADEIARRFSNEMIEETVRYFGATVFKCDFGIYERKDRENGVIELKLQLNKLCGWHALCLAGYVDDESYPGGGYFIARNSWSDDEWAPDSPEMPGYAMVPYDYVVELGVEGHVMTDFPNREVMGGKAGTCAGEVSGISLGSTLGGTSDRGYETWLAARKSALTRPMRDQDGVLLRPGSQVLVPDPANPTGVLRDTLQNRAKLRDLYERQRLEASVAAEKVREEQEKAAADARLSRFETVLRETVDSAFAADEYAIMTLATLKSEMLSRDPDLASVTEIDSRIRASVIALQKSDKRKYWFGRGFEVEEIRPSGEDAQRIFV